MQRISTNLTLFFKFFVPVFWLVFFGALVLAVFISGDELAAGLSSTRFRLGALFFYFSGLALFYFLLFPLKRVEYDDDFLYATNYFKTFRYPWHNIEDLEDSSFFLFTVVTVVLKEEGHFGQRIRFVASSRLYQSFLETHPELKKKEL
ncbi:MAG: hypothetical protein DA408_02625 [Bacteroidetes bacterium]|nr:MAG: hypothetical protein C7N36_06775 [Bacteroidota bacterium]PTM14495.1 MAG: hypothetical protein DA408_02625 [Bacteroidota bacterium]